VRVFADVLPVLAPFDDAFGAAFDGDAGRFRGAADRTGAGFEGGRAAGRREVDWVRAVARRTRSVSAATRRRRSAGLTRRSSVRSASAATRRDRESAPTGLISSFRVRS
jgi:hypothetical protein